MDACLKNLAAQPESVMSAADFAAVLAKCGLALGSPDADGLMLRCTVLDDGRVDFSGALLESKSAEAKPSVKTPEKVARPLIRPPASGSKLTPAETVMNSLADLKSKDPRERVHEARAHLAEIFRRYDLSQINAAGLVSEVERLGLVSTPAFESLVRTSSMDMTFSQMFQALLQLDKPFAASEAPPETPAVVFKNSRDRRASTDVVTWRQSEPGALSRADQKKQVVAMRPVSPKMRENKESPWNIAGTDQYAQKQVYSLDLNAPPSHKHFVEEASAKVRSSHVFEQQAKVALGPASEKKEQIYNCIRDLAQGTIGVKAFEHKIGEMINPLACPDQVVRLIHKAGADGSVNFQQFALAFEPVIQRITQEQAADMHAQQQAIAAQQEQVNQQQIKNLARLGAIQIRQTSSAQSSHGDLIGWTGSPSAIEKEEIHDALYRTKRHAQPEPGHSIPALTEHVDLSWKDEPNSTYVPTNENNGKHPHGKAHVQPRYADHDDMLTWKT